ncbi:hypothetical protein A4G18_00430 [Pasteurellaceae bacterium Pebbles2]|nr:hypothetical protein [Pasteurellaceae bacterium Pebbles2]
MKTDIRSILQSHLVTLGEYNTAWEGVKNTPTLPYQSVWLNISTGVTGAISNAPKAIETGFFQVTLYSEAGLGTRKIEERAELIRNHFYGQSLAQNGTQVVIHTPPVIGGVFLQDDKLVLPITINFTAYEL